MSEMERPPSVDTTGATRERLDNPHKDGSHLADPPNVVQSKGEARGTCLYCGTSFPAHRISARYCSDAHKTAYRRAKLAEQKQQESRRRPHIYPATGNLPSVTPQAIEKYQPSDPLTPILKKRTSALPKGWQFEVINEVTIRLTDGTAERVPRVHNKWAGHNSPRALAFVAEIGWASGGGNRWIVRSGDQSFGPLTLPAAKRAAVELALGRIKGTKVTDPLERLQRMQSGAQTVAEVMFRASTEFPTRT